MAFMSYKKNNLMKFGQHFSERINCKNLLDHNETWHGISNMNFKVMISEFNEFSLELFSTPSGELRFCFMTLSAS
ncbi:CLUMA_CG012529, isoform A [Clunio marinus]|uniref:CLUMA_CG012529, isoform A n=1 Tax=Clunio marinus TaxID=568069 RepID=A0A1J1IHG6_9DIPT|nr:CLUMA_CG012529, isoform A [Clunio marinus]